MIRKRLAFCVLTLVALAASLVTATPAEARRRSSFSIGFSYSSGGYHGGYHRHRHRHYRRYRPVRRVRVVRYAPRYRCGCGERFASRYWLEYHIDHSPCY